MATGASAPIVGLGWLDNGNGTITMFGEHWHGNQGAPSTDNGGLGIYDVTTGSELFRTQWIGVFNDIDETSSSFSAAGLVSSALTGHVIDPGNHRGSSYNDWLYTSPLTLGNGTWDLLTGFNCCIDEMTQKLRVTLTGITSVPDGTGPSNTTNPLPLPAAGWMLLAGIGGFAAMKRRKKTSA